MSVTVITDSASALPGEVAAPLDVVVMPIRIIVGDDTYDDGVLSHQELLDSPEAVSTAGPSPREFLRVIEEHASDDGTLILTVSHDLGSGTYLAAGVAAESSDRPVKVMDTHTAAGGQGLVALAAARAAASGLSLDKVEAEAARVAERVRLIATLPGLDHLAKSGHVPEAVAWAGRWIGLHPVIELRGGKVRPLRPSLSAEAAMNQIINVWRASRPSPSAALHVAGVHALDPSGAEHLLARVRAEVEPVEEFICPFGTGMIIHSGPGVVGMAWWWED